MSILITGSHGQLGRVLSDELTLYGRKHISLSSKQLDITNYQLVHDVIIRMNPNIIINTAAWTNVNEAEKNREFAFAVNHMGAENLARVAKKVNAVMIHLSTDYVFSGEVREPWSENAQTNPLSIYGLSKEAGEKAVLSCYPDRSYVVRTSWLYSEYKNNFVKMITRFALESSKEIRVVTDQIGQPTWATDLARQILLLTEKKANFGIYHASNSGQASRFDLAMEIFKLLGIKFERLIPILSEELPMSAIRPRFSVLGHENWERENISPMKNWKSALAAAMPSIISSIKRDWNSNED